MTFSDKLNTAMTIANVSNSELARALNVDRSTISRFRTGARGEPKPRVAMNMAQRIAANCTGAYQLTAFSELTGAKLASNTATPELMTEILYQWFIAEKDLSNNQVGNFLSKMQQFDSPLFLQEKIEPPTLEPFSSSEVSVYSDNAGKRKAVQQLISYVLQVNEPVQLWVFTDEDLTWRDENDKFIHEMGQCFSILYNKGCTCINIEHPMSSLEHSLRSIEYWLPAYMSGAAYLYYYPYARDNFHRRTLFVVPGHIVLLSASVANTRNKSMTFVITNRFIVDHYSDQFSDILSLCRQTMIRHTSDNIQEMFSLFKRFQTAQANGIYKSWGLPALSMPDSLIERISAESSPAANFIASNLHQLIEAKNHVLKNNIISEIIFLTPLSDVLAGRVKVPSTDLLPGGALYYTPLEYIEHLECTLCDLQKMLNYRVIIMDDPVWQDVVIYTKEDTPTVLIRDGAPVMAFEIAEQKTTNAFGDYLRRMTEEHMGIGTRQATIIRLKEEISRLRTISR